MKKLKLKCEVITPMFMTGANSRTPELRPSEFKGMMRFWWRAIKAEYNSELIKEEAKLFGGTGEDEGKSKIKILLKNKNLQIRENLKTEYSLNWYYDKRQKSLAGNDAGIGYLLYSTVLPGKERAFIKDNSNFILEIIAQDENSFNQSLASLWLAIHLGGFGTRARRGGGNICVKNVDNLQKMNDLNFIISGEDSSKIAQWLKDNFKKALKIINEKEGINKFCTSYSNLSFSRFVIAKDGKGTWKDALNDIGKIFSDFRRKYRQDIFDSAVFGLPVRHSKNTVKGRRAKDNFERRSSPLIFKCLKSNDKYYWIVIRMAGEFLPEGGILTFNNKSQRPDYKLIDEFWNRIKDKGYEFILNIPDNLEKIIEHIKKNLNPKKIILYGSRARGDAHSKADIDIAVDTDKEIASFDKINNIDLVNLNRINNSLLEKIEREGVVLYKRKS